MLCVRYAPIACWFRQVRAGMESEEEEEDGPCEWVGFLRIPLKPGSASGYVGVQHTKSKKRPWQATVSRPGKKRLGLGSFKKPVEAAVARAEAMASGVNLLPSPRKQAPRNSGSESCPPPVTLHHPPSFPFSCSRAQLTLHSVVKQSTALTPLTQPGASASYSMSAASEIAPLSALAAPAASAAAFSPPCAAYGVTQTARPLLPGQPLPQGVAAFGLALPAP